MPALYQDRVFFIVLRAMRKPLLILISIYTIAIVGMVAMPGVDANGQPSHMSIFHAFYFMTYTATTTGFGEIPVEFTNAQRMWAIFCLYISVIAWLYAIGTILSLIGNQYFVRANAERRFATQVGKIKQPFYIICGFGDTGSLLARGLDDAGLMAVVLDKSEERIRALELRDYRTAMPGLLADVNDPRYLIEAGIQRSYCKGVIALTHDEGTNYKIAVASQLLNPELPVICQSTSEHYGGLDTAIGKHLHIVDPFKIYSQYLTAAILNPSIHIINDWLIGARQGSLQRRVETKPGHWILCGYGRLNKRLHKTLENHDIKTKVIAPDIDDALLTEGRFIKGRVSYDLLVKANAAKASGIIAGTNSDTENLAILLMAKKINPDLFHVARQNRHEHHLLFDAAHPNIIMQPSLVTARRILFILTAPLLRTFFNQIRILGQLDATYLPELVEQLQQRVGGKKPILWSIVIDAQNAPSIHHQLQQKHVVTVGDLIRQPGTEDRTMQCMPLVLKSEHDTCIVPDDSTELKMGDEILLCGTAHAKHTIFHTITDHYTLRFIQTGKQPIRSTLIRALLGRQDW